MMMMKNKIAAAALAFPYWRIVRRAGPRLGSRRAAQRHRQVQGVTANQLIGYGIVTGLNQTGDSTSVLFTSKTIQNILQTSGSRPSRPTFARATSPPLW